MILAEKVVLTVAGLGRLVCVGGRRRDPWRLRRLRMEGGGVGHASQLVPRRQVTGSFFFFLLRMLR